VNAPSEKSEILKPVSKGLKEQLLELCIGVKRTVFPEAMDLIDLNFAVIGGLTWHSAFCRTHYAHAHKARLKDFNRLCKKTCEKLKIKYRNLLFCFHDEPSPAGEWHVHFLIGANGVEPVSHAVLAATLHDVWTRRFNNGTADIQVFDPNRQLDGVSYVVAVTRDAKGNEIENPPVRSTALLNLIQKEKAGIHYTV
jgi:hypothetical protein